MILGIKKWISKPKDLSSDSIFLINEMHFSNKYKLIRISDSIFRFKRLYRFQSDGWETIFKQLRFNDNGLIKVKNNKIIYVLNFTKQFIVTILGLITLFIIFWEVLNFSVLLSLN